jgi:hypothetical protein
MRLPGDRTADPPRSSRATISFELRRKHHVHLLSVQITAWENPRFARPSNWQRGPRTRSASVAIRAVFWGYAFISKRNLVLRLVKNRS